MIELTLAAALVGATPTQPESLYYTYAHASVKQGVDYCSLIIGSKREGYGESVFAIGYNAKEARGVILTTSSVTTSLPAAGEANMQVVFMSSGVANNQEGMATRHFKYVKSDGVYTFTGRVNGRKYIEELIEYTGKNETVDFFYDEKILNAFPLTGIGDSVSKLKECAFSVAGLSLLDPFVR